MTGFLVLWVALFVSQAAGPGPPTGSESSASEPTGTPATASAKPPCHNPDAAGTYHIGCGVTAPVATYQVLLDYPEEARAHQLLPNGMVIVLTVDAEGNPTKVHVKNSRVDSVDKKSRRAQQLLEDKMVETVKQYKFKPAMFQGKPVAVDLNISMDIESF
jgi:periplasmic protein TonB